MPHGGGVRPKKWHSDNSSTGSAVAHDPGWAGETQAEICGGDRLSLWAVYCVEESSRAAGTLLSLDRYQVEEDADPLWGRAEAQGEPRIMKTPWSQMTGQP